MSDLGAGLITPPAGSFSRWNQSRLLLPVVTSENQRVNFVRSRLPEPGQGVGGKGAMAMGTVENIKEAVRKLSLEELAAFRAWFAEFDAASWDREFEEDVAAGRLDQLAEEALRDLREGRCTDL